MHWIGSVSSTWGYFFLCLFPLSPPHFLPPHCSPVFISLFFFYHHPFVTPWATTTGSGGNWTWESDSTFNYWENELGSCRGNNLAMEWGAFIPCLEALRYWKKLWGRGDSAICQTCFHLRSFPCASPLSAHIDDLLLYFLRLQLKWHIYLSPL